jgi:hypothetical protein
MNAIVDQHNRPNGPKGLMLKVVTICSRTCLQIR